MTNTPSHLTSWHLNIWISANDPTQKDRAEWRRYCDAIRCNVSACLNWQCDGYDNIESAIEDFEQNAADMLSNQDWFARGGCWERFGNLWAGAMIEAGIYNLSDVK